MTHEGQCYQSILVHCQGSAGSYTWMIRDCVNAFVLHCFVKQSEVDIDESESVLDESRLHVDSQSLPRTDS